MGLNDLVSDTSAAKGCHKARAIAVLLEPYQVAVLVRVRRYMLEQAKASKLHAVGTDPAMAWILYVIKGNHWLAFRSGKAAKSGHVAVDTGCKMVHRVISIGLVVGVIVGIG